ncbi:MAG: murein biosynthesis integral membrane protein MurJ [Coriobacteriales bacterium]|nr:murein biosynthesis integral membrane protein MurJ [Coriobacteriales bacterium]
MMRRLLKALIVLPLLLAGLIGAQLGFAPAQTAEALTIPRPGPISILYVPGLQWSDITEKETPTLYRLVGSSGVGNISAPNRDVTSSVLGELHPDAYAIQNGLSPAEYDAEVTAWMQQADFEVLVITSAPAFAPDTDSDGGGGSNDNGGGDMGQLAPVIILGSGFDGYLSSDTTHRTRFIIDTDLSLLYRHIDKEPSSPEYSKASIVNIPTSAAADTRLRILDHEQTTTRVIKETKPSAMIAFLVFAFFAFGLSLVLLILGRRDKPGSRRPLIRLTRILWVIVLAFPPATFIMFFTLPQDPTPLIAVVSCGAWTAIIAFLALLIGQKTKWVNALIALFTLVIVVVLAGPLFGGALDTPGYFTYDITNATRYYGMGNEQGALLFGSWLTLSGLLINRFPKARFIPAFRRWGYALGSVLLLFFATSPWFGASFGPLVWGTFGCFVTWWLFNGRRIRWWGILIAAAFSFALAIGVLYLDVTFNKLSHMSWVIPSMQQGIDVLFRDIALRVWKISTNTIKSYVPVVAVAFLALFVAFLFVLRVFKPGSYREFWQRNAAFRAVYSVCFVIAVVTFFLEDSGIFTPAVLLIYPVSCFVWLVCDLHSWHLRVLEESTEPLTMGELQRQAIAEETDGRGEKDGESDEGEETGEGTLVASAAAPVVAPASVAAPATATASAAASAAAPVVAPATHPTIGRSAATMSVATTISRITGFLRTWAMAFALGNTMLTSAYSIANNVPNLIYELVAGGVLISAFLPIYLAQLEKHGKQGASHYASNLMSIAVVLLGLAALLASLFAPQVIFTQTFLTQGIDARTAVFFFRFFTVQIVFYGVGAIISGLLNAHRSFLWPALGPIFNNIVVIAALFAYPFIARVNPLAALVVLAIGTSIGVFAMFIVQIPALIKLKIPLRFHIDFSDPALKETLKLALPASCFIITQVVVISIQNAVALNVTAQGPATLQFAWLWFQLPYGIIGVALSTALLTEMSAASAAGDWASFKAQVKLGVRTTFFLIIPLAAIIFTLSNQLAGLYHAGAFSYGDVLMVARTLGVWCLALPFYAVYMLIFRVFSSLRDLSRFIVIDICGRTLQVIGYFVLTRGIGGWAGLGLLGIPTADLITYVLLTCACLILLRRRIGSWGLTGAFIDCLKILAATVLAILVPLLVTVGDYDQTIAISLAVIVACTLTTLAIFYAVCRVLRVPEVEMVNSLGVRLRARFKKGS